MPIGIADRAGALASFLQSQHRPLGAVICLLVIPLLPFLLVGLQDKGPSAQVRGIATRMARLLFLVYGATYVAIMVSNVVHPGEWDFPISWLNGYVGAHRLNFYDPDSYRRLAGALTTLTAGQVKYVISVGFHFPPPTIFLFLPLGFFDIHTAYFLWYLFTIGVAVLDVALLSRLFLGGTQQGTLLAAVLLLVLRPAMSTVWFGQTNFLILLMLLLLYRDRDTLRGGAWLAFGTLVKPMFALMVLYSVIGRRWRALGGAALVLTLLSLLTVAVFGWDTFAAYFGHNPVTRMPSDVYTEGVNQSLLAEILRRTQYDFSHGSPLTHPLFVVLVAGLSAITAWLVHRAHSAGDDDLALALTVPFALLIYPGTLAHYSVDLLVPLLVVWSRRHDVPGGVRAAVAFLTIEYVLMNADGSFAIVANALAWCGVAAVEGSRRLWIDPGTRPPLAPRPSARHPS